MDESIKKIDEEKAKMYKLNLINALSNEKFNGIIMGLDKAKEIILSEQPKDKCYSQNDCEYEDNGECTMQCPCPHQQKPLTIGDKIRESNESLAEFIIQQFGDSRVFQHGNEIYMEDYLNQSSTGTP